MSTTLKTTQEIIDELTRRIGALQTAKENLAKVGTPLVSEIETQTEIYNSILKFINSK